MPTARQGRNSLPGLTHSKIYWLQETCGYRKKGGSLCHWAKDCQGVCNALQALLGHPCPTSPPWPAIPPSPWSSSGRMKGWLVRAGDAVDTATASCTKHKGKAPGTANRHRLHRQSPRLSWNLQDWPHIWSQVLGLTQSWKKKPRGDFSFSHRTSELERLGGITSSKIFIF